MDVDEVLTWTFTPALRLRSGQERVARMDVDEVLTLTFILARTRTRTRTLTGGQLLLPDAQGVRGAAALQAST